jgi:hypothetical protein
VVNVKHKEKNELMKTNVAIRRTTATCSTCGTVHEGIPVAADEDGYADLDTEPCSDDECTTRLCGACPQFACHCCGLTFCLAHVAEEIEPECICTRIDVDLNDACGCELHGTRYPKSLYFCRVCTAPEELVTGIEPVTEYAQIAEATFTEYSNC